MTPSQRSVTTAFLVTGLGLAVYHHWPSQLASWASKAPSTAPATAAKNIIPVGGLNDVQAAIIAYIALFLLAETDAGPVATALSWAIATTLAFGAILELQKEYPSIFSGGAGQGAQGAQGSTTQPQGPQLPGG